MIWESTILMTVIDLLILGAVCYALLKFYYVRKYLEAKNTRIGLIPIILGLSFLGLFFLADLLTMHALPHFMSKAKSMAIMENLHLNYSWIVALFGVGSIAIGVAITSQGISALIRKLRKSESELKTELEWRTKSTQELVNSEKRLQQIAEAGSDWFWEMDENLRFSYFSENFTDITGVQQSALLGKTRQETGIADVDPEAWEKHLSDLAAHRPFRDFRHPRVLPDERRVFLSINGKPVFDNDGTFIGYRGTGTDKTAEVAAHLALEESEKQFRNLVEGSIQGVYVHQDWNFLFANQSLAEIFGYESAAEVLSLKRVERLISLDERPRLYNYITARQKGESAPEIYEARGIKKDGSIIWLEFRVTQIDWLGTAATQCVVIDITERKNNEILNLRLARIVEDSINEIYVFDAETLKFIQVNASACENLGYTKEELIGLTPVDLKPEHTTDTFADLLAPLRNGKTDHIKFETIHRRKDGSRYDVEVTLQQIRSEEKPVFAAIIEDITERKQAEDQLRQAQKMEAVGQLTGGIAHDFNNLLAVVQGNLDLVQRRFALPTPANDLITEAIAAAERGATLTQGLLGFSRKQTLQPELISLTDIVSGMGDLLRRTLGENIEMDIITDDELWICKVDPRQFENVLLNLAINARDAMPEGGKLIIETANVPLDGDCIATQDGMETGDYVMLSVWDNGSGMSPEVLEYVFQPYFTTKAVGEGSGLGLSMVYGFAKQSGGTVEISSEVGQGTTVKLYLPRDAVAKADVLTAVADVGKKLVGGSETILVVEDDPAVRKVTVFMLEELGYQVLKAKDGASAMAVLKEEQVDLLFSDIVMPGGMRGDELAKLAVESNPDLKVLHCSGFGQAENLHSNTATPSHAVLKKPYRIQDLDAAVRQSLAVENSRQKIEQHQTA